MFPSETEDILQDTKNAQKTVVLPKKTSIFLLGLIAIAIAMGFLKYRSLSKIDNGSPQTSSPSQQVLTPTNTFVDTLFGTIVYFKGNDLFEYQLPIRSQRQLIGLKSEEEEASLFKTPIVWSPDGKYMAVVDDSSHAALIQYDNGFLLQSFALHEKVSKETQVSLSIDPASQVLAVGFSRSQGVTSESIQFFSFESGKELGFYPRCERKGIWLEGVGFVTKCALGDVESVVLIQFQTNSTTMIPLTKETTTTKYTLIDDYEGGTVIALRKVNTKQDLVSIAPTGKIKVIPTKDYPKGVDLAALTDIYGSLAKRIEKQTGFTGVKNVSVATTNDWLAFETEKGIYIVDVLLKEKPYFIGAGSLPVLRPY